SMRTRCSRGPWNISQINQRVSKGRPGPRSQGAARKGTTSAAIRHGAGPAQKTGGFNRWQGSESKGYDMSQAAAAVKEDFAALLEESFDKNETIEGNVLKGTII